MLAIAPILAVVTMLQAPTPDTVRIEVGSPLVNGRVYQPHRARVRVHIGSTDAPVVNEWINELTLGDSAGRPVMRWVTRGQIDTATGEAGYDLRQTYDAVTLAPLGYALTTRSGARVRLAIDGTRMRGTRRTPNDTTTRQVDQPIPRLGFYVSASDLLPAAVGFREGAVYIAPVWGPNMPAAENRIFSVKARERLVVEGSPVMAWKVEERRESDRVLLANWYLTDVSPYMVAGDVFLPDGRVQKMTEIALP